jgi:hypothetical protein
MSLVLTFSGGSSSFVYYLAHPCMAQLMQNTTQRIIIVIRSKNQEAMMILNLLGVHLVNIQTMFEVFLILPLLPSSLLIGPKNLNARGNLLDTISFLALTV